MKISGGTTLGNCAMGSPTIVTSPTMTMIMEITMATIGRLMKNFDMGLIRQRYNYSRMQIAERSLIPEGCLTITQRFSVGYDDPNSTSPEGTAGRACSFNRPFGTCKHVQSLTQR